MSDLIIPTKAVLVGARGTATGDMELLPYGGIAGNYFVDNVIKQSYYWPDVKKVRANKGLAVRMPAAMADHLIERGEAVPAVVSGSGPATPTPGDMWYDTTSGVRTWKIRGTSSWTVETERFGVPADAASIPAVDTINTQVGG